MLNTTVFRVGACLAGAMVGVFLLVAVPGFQWGHGTALVPPDIAPVEVAQGDGVLKARIEASLRLSPVVGSTRITVDVAKGAVLLSGPMDDPTQAQLALFVVANMPGVIRVESILSTRAQDQASDAAQRDVLDVEAARAGFLRNGTLGQAERPGGSEPTPLQAPPGSETGKASRLADSARASHATGIRAMVHGALGIASVHDEQPVKR